MSYSSTTGQTRQAVEDKAHAARESIHRGIDHATTKAHEVGDQLRAGAHQAKQTGQQYLDRLRKVQSFSDYDDVALGYASAILTATMTPIFYRPFRNLQILQQLDTHGPNQEPRYNGYLEGFKKIAREEGILGLFKGGIGQAIYEVFRFGARYTTLTCATKYVPSSVLDESYLPFVGLVLEVVTDTIGYPICTACTRLVAQNVRQPKYDGIVDALEKISGEDDPNLSTDIDPNPFKPVWYAGLVPHLVGITTFTLTEVLVKLIFDKVAGLSPRAIYESNNLRIDRVPSIDFDLNSKDSVFKVNYPLRIGRDANDKPDYLLACRNPLAFAISYLATYPFSTIERRMQAGDKSIKGLDFIQALQKIADREGPAALWKGILFN